MCTRGADCTFAHSADELQPLPNLYKTKMCFDMAKNKQCQDPNCPYAHTRNELRNVVYESRKEDPEAEFGQDNMVVYAQMARPFYPMIGACLPWPDGETSPPSFVSAMSPGLVAMGNSPWPFSPTSSVEEADIVKEADGLKEADGTCSRQTTPPTSDKNSLCSISQVSSEDYEPSEPETCRVATSSPATNLKWIVKNTFLELTPSGGNGEDSGARRLFRSRSSPVVN